MAFELVLAVCELRLWRWLEKPAQEKRQAPISRKIVQRCIGQCVKHWQLFLYGLRTAPFCTEGIGQTHQLFVCLFKLVPTKDLVVVFCQVFGFLNDLAVFRVRETFVCTVAILLLQIPESVLENICDIGLRAFRIFCLAFWKTENEIYPV